MKAFDKEDYVTVFAAPNSNDLLSSELPRLNSIPFKGAATPKEVFQGTNEIIDIVCQTPQNPVSESICEAQVEVIFAVDGLIFNNQKYRKDLQNFFKETSILFGFDSVRPVVLVGRSNVNLGSNYRIEEFANNEDEFPLSVILNKVANMFEEDSTETRKVIVSVSMRQANSTDLKETRSYLLSQNISLIAISINNEYFMPSFDDNLNVKTIKVFEDELLPKFASSVVMHACSPYTPPPPLPRINPDDRRISCPAGEITFLYDIALFSPPRDGRKITSFLKRIIDLVGDGSVYARATRFNGRSFGATSAEEFSVETKNLLKIADTKHYLEKMDHDEIERVSPANAGQALIDTVDDLKSHQDTQYVLLMIGRNSFDDLEKAVQYAKKNNVQVITFYIGGLKFEPNQQMSTVENGEIIAQRLYDLINLEYELIELLCDTQPATIAPIIPTIPPTFIPPTMDCKLDIVLAIDDALLHYSKRVKYLRQFFNVWIPSLYYGEDEVMISAFTFGKKASNLFKGFLDDKLDLKIALTKRLKPKTATGPFSFAVGANRAIKIFGKSKRADEDVKKLIIFIVARGSKSQLSTSKLSQLTKENILVTSVVMMNAAKLPPEQLSNFDSVLDVGR